MLEHAVLIGDVDQFIVALALLVTNVGKIRITFLTVFANETRIVVLSKHISLQFMEQNNVHIPRSPSRMAQDCYWCQYRSWQEHCILRDQSNLRSRACSTKAIAT